MFHIEVSLVFSTKPANTKASYGVNTYNFLCSARDAVSLQFTIFSLLSMPLDLCVYFFSKEC